MGRRGPPPEPEALRVLKGATPRRKPLTVPHGAPKPPSFLSTRERELFERVLASPMARRLIGDAAMPLGRYCVYLRLWSDAKAALDDLATTTVEVVSKHVTREVRCAPLTDMFSLEAALTTLEDRLGLTPAARQRLAAELAVLPAARPAAVEADDSEQVPSPIGFGLN